MSQVNRREFVRDSAKVGLTASLAAGVWSEAQPAKSKEASDRVTLAFLGLGGRATGLLAGFVERDDIDVAYLCDPDPTRNLQFAEVAREATGHVPRRVGDYRRVLDDPTVDAVVIATPDHWHSPLAVFACMAGKDVYVEKPLSHNVWEGRKAVEAARNHDRVVQVGTQNRSAAYNRAAIEFLRGGGLGRIPLCKVYNLKPGKAYHEPPDGPKPKGVDYNMWLGPAPERPFNAGHFHKNWHYYWAYSGGDMANDGVHQLDLARWVIGKDFPTRVHSTGGNFAFDEDDNETPDTQIATFDFDDMRLVYEQIDYGDAIQKTDSGVRNGEMFPYWLQNSTRIELYGTKGLMVLGRHGGGWQVFGKPYQRKPQVLAEQYGQFPDPDHKQNFVDCIRSRRRPNADVEEGHRSATLVHLANISYRLGGRALDFDAATESITNDAEANAMLRREARPEFAIPEKV